MKRVLFLLFSICILSLAEERYELSLYNKIFPLIFNKDKIKIYGDKKDTKIFEGSYRFIIAKDCNSSDFVFGNIDKIEKQCVNIPRFVKSYKFYKNKHNVFGAFYWRKGRPQLKFKVKTILKYDLNLPDALKEYAQ